MKIVDMTAGNRAIWFDKQNPLVTFLDERKEVVPDLICDSTNTELISNYFDLIVFDPPHVNFGANSNMSKVYGNKTTKQIKEFIVGINKESFRIARPNALMALKWNDHDTKLDTVLALLSDWEPLFGHKVSNRLKHVSNTYWVLLKVGVR